MLALTQTFNLERQTLDSRSRRSRRLTSGTDTATAMITSVHSHCTRTPAIAHSRVIAVNSTATKTR